jgi:hypothetical protein
MALPDKQIHNFAARTIAKRKIANAKVVIVKCRIFICNLANMPISGQMLFSMIFPDNGLLIHSLVYIRFLNTWFENLADNSGQSSIPVPWNSLVSSIIYRKS